MLKISGDPNDCTVNPDACEHICHTHNDSYYCTCYSGYRLASNGRTCDGESVTEIVTMFSAPPTEIDECSEGLSNCNMHCVNTIGSYYCTCFTGFQLMNNNHTCTDINECISGNRGCEQTCTNTNGSYYCSCLTGYLLDNNNHNCSGTIIIHILIFSIILDINECLIYNGNCSHHCNNIPGSYMCSCNSGYIINIDGHNCSGKIIINNFLN